ncbi:hypothetical protein CVS40_9035 [Lucilia cuprina]|nr:hypothetical protein CVS40_9035 [Lucilia cuprina]
MSSRSADWGLRGEVKNGSNTTIVRLRRSAQSIVLTLDGFLSVGSIFRGTVFDKVYFGFVVAVLVDGIELVGQISNIGLFVENIDGSFLFSGLFGQSEGSIFETLVFGSFNKNNTETLFHTTGNFLGSIGIIEFTFRSRESVVFLF